jgi:hypothetical protein
MKRACGYLCKPYNDDFLSVLKSAEFLEFEAIGVRECAALISG